MNERSEDAGCKFFFSGWINAPCFSLVAEIILS